MKKIGLFLSLFLLTCGLAFAQDGFFGAADESFAGSKEVPPEGATTGVAAPTLGTYSNTNVLLSGNGTVTPSAAPTNALSATAFTSSNFKGLLDVDPATGVVRVTNAYPAGTYTVTVRAFDASGSVSRTFNLTVSAAPGCGSFGTSAFSMNSYGAGSSPFDTVIGDFNGDGRQDIAVANLFQSSFNVLLRNAANNGFDTSVSYSTPDVRSIAAADFNGDGKTDLVAGKRAASGVIVHLRNAANNGFDAPIEYATTGSDIFSVAAGDFNGDGRQDVATANYTSGNVSVLLRNATNDGFEAAVNLAAGTNPDGIAVGDFNGDGKTDLAVANQSSNNVSVFLRNSANNGFDAAVNYGVGGSPYGITAGDFNGDGRQDIVTANQTGQNVSVLVRNAANNGFDRTDYPVGFLKAIAAGDFNHDGKLDLVAPNGSNVYILLRNAANDGFDAPVAFNSVGVSIVRALVGDFNGDNRQDVVTANSNGANVTVLTRVCDAAPPDTTITATPSNPSNSSSATFTFSGTDDVSLPAALTFECSLDNAAFSACTSPQNYSGLSDGNRTFAVRAKDQVGSIDPTPATYLWTIDTIAPTISLSTTATSPTTSAFSVTALFSENVSGFDLSDISVVNGFAGNFAGSGNAYTFTVTPTAGGLVTVTIPAGAAQDAAGNNNAFTGPLSMVFSNPFPLVVTKTVDTNDGVCNADCSLREAVAAANSTVADEAITFNIPSSDPGCVGGVCTITLTSGEIVINSATTAGVLFVRNTNGTRANLVVSGNNISRIFNIAAGGDLTIDAVTITRGRTAVSQNNGGAVTNAGSFKLLNSAVTASSASVNSNGGGLSNTGELILDNTLVSGNSATNTGGAFFNNGGILSLLNSTVSGNSSAGGGGIYNINGTLNLLNSSVSNNLQNGPSGGGGISSLSGTINLANTSVTGNSSSSNAGGIFNDFNSVANVTSSTISGNSAGSFAFGGGIYNRGTLNSSNNTISGNSVGANLASRGGGVHSVGTVRARNTIIAGNTAPANPDFFGALAVDENNLIGVSVSLGPLGFYGGPTQTQPLLSSATTAINAGNNCVLNQSCVTFNAPVPLTTDQRGATRVGNVDIGAVEVNSSANGGTFKAVLPSARTGLSYATTLIPTVPSGTTYAVTAGALPTGLTLGATALAGIADELTSAPQAGAGISGIPTFGGTFDFTITVNSGGNTTATDYQMLVNVPTSAGVSIEGRVTTANGRGIANAFVMMTDATGQVRTAKTAALGYFRFEDVAAGQTVVLNVKSRKFSFAPKVVFLSDSVSGLDLVGTP